MIRKPIVAGMFYSENKEMLEKEIIDSFKSIYGPGELPIERKDKKIVGVIVPHAGYYFSGAGQAWGYKEIAESEEAELYIILGTSHSGFPKAAICLEDFETPLGVVEVDKEFARSLMIKNAVVENNNAHEEEHSIEVQIPFLQFVNKGREDKIKIVPIVIGHKTDYAMVGQLIAKTIEQFNKKTVLICSSDFTHYGIRYGYMPFTSDVKENIEKIDKGAIKYIEKIDSRRFIEYVEDKEATICGSSAIAVFIEICKALGAKEAKVLSYFSSGDISKDWSNVVGYCSIIVEKS